MQRMRVLVVGALLTMVGCGSPVGTTDARDTCRSHGFSDEEIYLAFALVQADLDAGVTAQQQIDAATSSCRDGVDGADGGCVSDPSIGPDYTVDQCTSDCVACISAIVDQLHP